jgi:7-carboxy-7-deazaguanine synthase
LHIYLVATLNRKVMQISEIFNSIQGEGPAMGQNVTFIRLAGCNLSCAGCDTDHIQNHDYSIEKIVSMVRIQAVITGGEPCLQDILPLAKLIKCDLETNGTIPIDPGFFRYAVVSPKQGSEIDFDYWNKYDNVHFKFVIGPAPWCWQEIPDGLKNVWLMPYGIDPLLRNAKNVWDMALKNNYNYSDRLHIRVERK